MPKTIEFHNTPQFYLAYVKNWLTHEKKGGKASPAEIAIIEDIAKLVEIAVAQLAPVPEEPGKQN